MFVFSFSLIILFLLVDRFLITPAFKEKIEELFVYILEKKMVYIGGIYIII
jgi:hypothetical protein